MNPYLLLVAGHVVSVLFCAGPMLAVALAPELPPSPALRRLALVSSIGLLGLFLTGVGAVAMTGAAFVHSWWLRLSVLLMLLVGALTVRLRRVAKKPASARTTRSLAWTITAALILAVCLMEVKPF